MSWIVEFEFTKKLQLLICTLTKLSTADQVGKVTIGLGKVSSLEEQTDYLPLFFISGCIFSHVQPFYE